MTRRLKFVARLAVVTALVASAPTGADGVIPELAPEDVQEALEVGARGLTDPDFGAEWRVSLPGGEEIAVTTPFARLALAARRAAYRGESLGDRDRQTELDRSRGRLQLLVTMYGGTPDFSRWYRAVLSVGDRHIKATFVQNERTALKLADGRFAARNLYVFPLAGLPTRESVTLVVESMVDGQEILRAPLDLSKMR